MVALPQPRAFVAVPVSDAAGRLCDVRLEVDGRVWHLAGRGGPEAEVRRVEAALAAGGLPVFLGAGLPAGIAAARRLHAGPILVADRLAELAAVTGVAAACAADAGVRLLDDADPEAVVAAITAAARQAGSPRLAVIIHPVAARLNPEWTRRIAAGLAGYTALRDRLRYRKFASAPPRVLLLRRPYFLYREIETALARLGASVRVVDTGRGATGQEGVVAAILEAVAAFRPDMALTVNHLGLDREGRLTGLLADIGLPLASWFVDSPRLILHDYPAQASPLVMVFSYDADALPELSRRGFAHAAWLPLATDPRRFAPLAGADAPHPWRARVSFVGASMVEQAATALARLTPFPALARALPGAAAAFADSPEKSALRFLLADPACGPAMRALPSAGARLDAELALTWEATRRYRHACLRGLAGMGALVVGDTDWEAVLPGSGRDWRRIDGLDYYADLPDFYPRSAINLNTTSLQMKGAVNQRVFDVPAAGAFLLTDDREQARQLFDADREMAVYRHPGEIPDMVRHYLAHSEARQRIADAARARILAGHTYEHRLRTLLSAMQKAFGD